MGTIDLIQRRTADAFQTPIRLMTDSARYEPGRTARHIAMYLCYAHTDLPKPEIGAHFGGRDRRTVDNAIKRARIMLNDGGSMAERIVQLSRSISREMA